MRVKVHIGNAPHDCDEVRRLRGEVRRLRRALRWIIRWHEDGEFEIYKCPEDIAEAALAPRRRKT